jgi:hypothetical protein
MPTSTRARRAAARERERLPPAWRRCPVCRPFPSEANMILVRVPDARHRFAGMKARGVLVKNIAGLHPLLANCLRLTVGTPDENDAMMPRPEGIPMTAPMTHHRTAEVRRDTQETQIRVRVNLDGTAQAQLPPASASSTTCSTRSPATA